MMPLQEKRKVHLGVLVHKLRGEKGPTQLIDDYTRDASNHQYQTRAKTRGDMITKTRNTVRFERSTIHRATETWNSIPEQIRNIDNTSNFKRTYQASFLAQI